MKFERPIAQIEKFELEDVISTSGGGDASDTDFTTIRETDDRTGTIHGSQYSWCFGDKTDNYIFNDCG